jgi:hypothetical protein
MKMDAVAWAALANKGLIVMKTGKIENSLAVIGALIVLFAVTSAVNTALADENNLLDNSLKIAVATSG